MKNQVVREGDARVRQNFWKVPNLSESSSMGILTGVHYCKVWSRTGQSREELPRVLSPAPRRGIDV